MQTIIPVSLTESALEEVKNIMQNKNIPEGYKLRVGIKGSGGCSGFTFMLGFDKKKEGDIEFDASGIQVLVEKKHAMYLLDMEVDFHNGDDARGFTFAKKSKVDA